MSQSFRIGVISDTHGLLRPEARAALAGCDHILHAGDIGDDSILATLARMAPLTAIRGNVDHGGTCGALPATQAVELAGKLFYLLHCREELDLVPEAAAIAAVIFGHTHRAEIAWDRGVLYFNPGSAGPRRFRLPVSIGILECAGEELRPYIEELALQ